MRENLIASIVERWKDAVELAMNDCDQEEVEEVNRRIGLLIVQSGPRRSAYFVTERERYVLNAMVQGWDENDDRKLPGHVSYQDVLDLVKKFGLEEPANTLAFLSKYEGGKFKGWDDLLACKIIDDKELNILKRHGVWEEIAVAVKIAPNDGLRIRTVRRHMLDKLVAKGIIHNKMTREQVAVAMLREARP